MAIIPIRKIPTIQEYAVSTCGTITKGQVLTMGGSGAVTNTLTVYATCAPICCVAAEPKATAASLAAGVLSKIKCWQILPETTWEASCSGTASSIGIGSLCNLQNGGTGVQYSATTVTTGGVFVIEEIVSTSKVRGKLRNALYAGRRSVLIGGTA